MEKKRTILQNNSLHKGCQQIADILIENGVSLNMLIKNMEIRPTMNSIKDIFRAIAKEKYGVDSTADLEQNQIDPIWEELVHGISKHTGTIIPFPSKESLEDYWNFYN